MAGPDNISHDAVLNLQIPSSQSTKSVPFGLLSLSRALRDKIYRQVLVVAHPIYLFQESESQPVETFAPDRPSRWLAVMYTNRQVHDEASALFYGSNLFSFVETTPYQVGLIQCFLNGIGSENASLLSRLCINFPSAERTQEKMVLTEDGARTLALLQEKCTSLRTLEILVYGKSYAIMIAEGCNESQALRNVLSQIDMRLKSITSLTRVTVRFCEGAPSPTVTSLMQDLGWEVSFR